VCIRNAKAALIATVTSVKSHRYTHPHIEILFIVYSICKYVSLLVFSCLYVCLPSFFPCMYALGSTFPTLNCAAVCISLYTCTYENVYSPPSSAHPLSAFPIHREKEAYGWLSVQQVASKVFALYYDN